MAKARKKGTGCVELSDRELKAVAGGVIIGAEHAAASTVVQSASSDVSNLADRRPAASATPVDVFEAIASAPKPRLKPDMDPAAFYSGLLANVKRNALHHVTRFLDNIQRQYKVDPNQQDMYGKTVAHYLVEYLNTVDPGYAFDVLNKFLDLGVNLHLKDVRGKTPIDLASTDATRSRPLMLLNKYAGFHKMPASKPVLDVMASDISKVLVGSIDGIQGRNFLAGYPSIQECHCSDALSRSGGKDLRKSFEDTTLRVLNGRGSTNEVTMVGSGNLLDSIALIARLKDEQPGGTLRLNLIDHSYKNGTGHNTQALFDDFMKCMKENGVSVNVVSNESGARIVSAIVPNADFTLTLAVHGDTDSYARQGRKPDVMAGVDLDMEQFNQDQHNMMAQLAAHTQAKHYVSVNRSSIRSDVN